MVLSLLEGQSALGLPRTATEDPDVSRPEAASSQVVYKMVQMTPWHILPYDVP